MGIAILSTARSSTGMGLLRRLRAVVLLGGSVRPGRFAQSIRRPLFELPLDTSGSILDRWLQETATLSQAVGAGPLAIRVMIDRETPPSARPSQSAASVSLSIEPDPQDLRGTGGVLRDVSQDYDNDDLLLVSSAAQVLLTDLVILAESLAHAGGDISLVSHQDGTPGGLMLLRCGAMRGVPASGFIDMKEQALPAIARSRRVMVVHRQRASSLTVRTLDRYIMALRRHHQGLAGVADGGDPFAEEWAPVFSLVEAGASVAADVRLHDSVVLRDARVESEAVLVQAVACPGAVVRRRTTLVNALALPGVMMGNSRSRVP